MTERVAFVQACLDRRTRIVDICAQFGISEKTGHKLLRRFRREGLVGLADRSHAPQHPVFAVAPGIAARIVALRRQHPLYGAAKLRDWLCQHEPAVRWPAASTIGELLKREGLIRRRRRAHGAAARVLHGRTAATAPNVVWTADFKGQFHLAGGPLCYPLTLLDLHSHFLLRCTALPSVALAPTRRHFAATFREYGLPDVLRTDNGVPFAQPNAVGRLGALAYWWIRLGIRPEHIRPATPAENGAHERFHKTLKAHTVHPAAASLTAQQRRFDRFRTEYNTERPHASLPAHHPPATTYTASPRPYLEPLPPLLYDGAAAVRLVDAHGVIKWHGTPIFLSSNLTGELVGLYDGLGDTLRIQYAALTLGNLELPTRRFVPEVRWTG
jgi:transposase InsO family protein